MMPLLATLKKGSYLLLTCMLTLAFWALYTFFDFRQGGTHLTIFSTHVMPLQFFVAHFGAPYTYSRIVLDLLISLLTAVLLAVTLDQYRNGSTLFKSTTCSTGATVLLGLTTFGCPSCVLPIAGTFGAIFTVQALPLFGFEFKILSLLIVVASLVWLLYRLRSSEQVQVAPQS